MTGTNHGCRATLLVGAVAAFALAALACSKESSPPVSKAAPGGGAVGVKKVSRSAAAAKETVTTPKMAAPKPTLDARVVVDISESMRGFTGVRSQVLTTLHQVIRDTFAETGLVEAKRCLLGRELSCDRAPARPRDYANPRLYGADVSRLDRALVRVPVPSQVDPDNPPPPDLLDEARLTVLITDGMQASAGGLKASDDSAANVCQSGADPSCVTSLLRGRVREGFGMWLAQVSLPFKGRHFTERDCDQVYAAETRTHLEKVNLNPRWNKILFKIKPPSKKFRWYTYWGFKPLLVLVISRDATLGRRYHQAMLRRLRAEPIQPGEMRPEEAAQGMELAPLTPSRLSPAGLSLLTVDQQKGIIPEALAEFRLQKTKLIKGGVAARVWCGAKGKARMAFSFKTEAQGEGLPPYIAEASRLVPTEKTRALPSAALLAPKLEGGVFHLGLNCTPLPAGKTVIKYQLTSALKLDQVAAEEQWWVTLSAGNTYEMPERIYGLKELVMGVLKQSCGQERIHGPLWLSVERE